jgi:hypothetical protein
MSTARQYGGDGGMERFHDLFVFVLQICDLINASCLLDYVCRQFDSTLTPMDIMP